jgi:hypothetical protein
MIYRRTINSYANQRHVWRNELIKNVNDWCKLIRRPNWFFYIPLVYSQMKQKDKSGRNNILGTEFQV